MAKDDPLLETPPELPDYDLWAAIHTNARSEKVVAKYLEAKKIPHFLPMTLNRRKYGGRVRHSWIPLFPGYLFYATEGVDKTLVYKAKKVVQILVPTAPEILRADLENLAKAIQRKPDLVQTKITEPGTPVEVIAGPFLGTRGELVRRKNETVLVIRVHFVGYGAEMNIDESHVKVVDPE